MIVKAKMLKNMRLDKKWTQQKLADECNLNVRTIQRVEKDGVASNDTVSAYSAVFEIQTDDLIVSPEQLAKNNAERISLNYIWLLIASIIGGAVGGLCVFVLMLIVKSY